MTDGRDEIEKALAAEQLRAERAESRLDDVIEGLSEGFVLYGPDGRLIRCNNRFRELFSHTADRFQPGTHFEDIIRDAAAREGFPDAAGREQAWIEERIAAHRDPGPSGELRLADGKTLLVSGRRTRDGGLVRLYTDITAFKEAEAGRRDIDARFRSIAENLPGIVFRRVLKPGGRIEMPYVSASIRDAMGLDAEALQDDPTLWLSPIHPEDVEGVIAAHHESARQLSWLDYQFRVVLPDGTIHWMRSVSKPHRLDNGEVHWDGVSVDITEQKKAEEQLSYLAFNDPLTGLYNRALFNDRLEHCLAHAKRSGTMAAVFYLDLDHFKDVNDTLGHAFGDQLLKAVARRLRSIFRETDSISRLGGDEFAMALSEVPSQREAKTIAGRLVAGMGKPFRIARHSINVGVSVGVAMVVPEPGRRSRREWATEVLKQADIALYEAKRSGRNNYRFYEAHMHAEAQSRMSLRQMLHEATERQEFELHYQPQVDLCSGALVGLEALIRWRHPELGLQRPDQFIPIAEESGLIVPIGDWVLHEACRQMVAWHAEGLPKVSVAVNVSGVQIQRSDLVGGVRRAVEENGLDPQHLEIELTESSIMTRSEFVIGMLEDLRDLGARLAIDDFGTGYSSFAYLRAFPIDRLKIDQLFVRHMAEGSDDEAIVRAIIAVARSLGLDLVAEGIETETQAHFLKQEGCGIGQGYLYSPPLPAADCTAFLRQRACDKRK